jgi:hypothetical protein
MKEFDNLGRGPNDELPHDPEGMNDDRAEWARAAVEAFRAATGTDDGDAISDLLADLMHLCDREPDTFGASFRRQLERAAMHYEEETAEVEEVDASEVVGAQA